MDDIQIEALALEMGKIIKTTDDFRQLIFCLENITLQIVCDFKKGKCIYAGNSEKTSFFRCEKSIDESHFPFEKFNAVYNHPSTEKRLMHRFYKKNQITLSDKKNKIFVLFAKGITLYEMTHLLKTLYRSSIFDIPIHKMIDTVQNSVAKWHHRTLDSFYSIVYFDFNRIQVITDSDVIDKLIFFALGINSQGHKEILGIWLAQTEQDTSFWLTILTEIKNRGLDEIHIACVDPIGGVLGVMNQVYPKTRIQLRDKA